MTTRVNKTVRSISVVDAVHARLKARAAADGVTITELVEHAVDPVFEMTAEEQQKLVEQIRRSNEDK